MKKKGKKGGRGPDYVHTRAHGPHPSELQPWHDPEFQPQHDPEFQQGFGLLESNW